MNAMLKKVIEYVCNVEEVLSGCGVEEDSLGISNNSRAGRPPIRKRDREKDRRDEGGWGTITDRKGSD